MMGVQSGPLTAWFSSERSCGAYFHVSFWKCQLKCQLAKSIPYMVESLLGVTTKKSERARETTMKANESFLCITLPWIDCQNPPTGWRSIWFLLPTFSPCYVAVNLQKECNLKLYCDITWNVKCISEILISLTEIAYYYYYCYFFSHLFNMFLV